MTYEKLDNIRAIAVWTVIIFAVLNYFYLDREYIRLFSDIIIDLAMGSYLTTWLLGSSKAKS